MVNLAKAAAICCMVLGLAGCATVSDSTGQKAADWSSVPLPEPDFDRLEPLDVDSAAPLVVPPGPLATDWGHETWVSIKRWSTANGVVPQGKVAKETFAPHAIARGKETLILSPGTKASRWCGMEVHLGYAPQLSKGELYVHQLDARKTLSPLFVPPERTVFVNPRPVVIDPGHGGEDPGAQGAGGLIEKNLTLDWARRVAAILASNGWPVLLTRTNDCDLALSNRVAFADKVNAAAFVSLHFNTGVAEKGRGGVETYCLTPAGLPSSVTRGFPDDLFVRWPNNEHDIQNFLFACSVHRELLGVAGVRDRGVRRARFMGILRNQSRPAILVEGGYLSEPSEARLIGTAAHRQRLAEAVARAIMRQEPPSDIAAADLRNGVHN